MINCKDCMYWIHRESEKGECHFNIPVIFDDEAVGFWPTTFDDDCCAQGKSKEVYSCRHCGREVTEPKEGGWSSYTEDDKNIRLTRIAESMRQSKEVLKKEFGAVAHESNPLPRTRPIYTTQKINKMQRVVDAAILSLDKCQLELLEAVKEYQCQKS